MKKLLLILLTIATLFAGDARLNNYPQAQEWEKNAKTDADAAYNLALIYQTEIKDFKVAISLYEHSFSLEKSKDVANNLGVAYEYIKDYDEAIKWYKKTIEYNDADAAYNLALLYDEKLQNYDEAIVYYIKADSLKDKDAAVSLALLYKKLHQYDDAVFYYKKAYEQGNMGGANGLGYLYDVNLKDTDKGIIWYKKAAKGGHAEAINNLGRTYHELKDDTTASAYIFAMANYGYSKKDVLDFLKNDWKIDRPTLEKAYKLQQILDIPKHYTGGID